MQVLYQAGYVSLDTHFDAGHTYVYDGRSGSLDHVLAPGDFINNFTDADVWNINSVESVGFEYSRYNSNITNLYSADPYRSSDHNPLVAGFNLSQPNEKVLAPVDESVTPPSDSVNPPKSKKNPRGECNNGRGNNDCKKTVVAPGHTKK